MEEYEEVVETEEVSEEIEEVEETETEMVEQDAEPTSEVEEVEEVEEKAEKTVPLDALKDERKKRQAIEDELKAIRESVDSLKTAAPPKDINEAYDRDPDGVMRDINAELDRLDEEDTHESRKAARQLSDLKAELRRKEFTNLQKTLNQQTSASKVMSTITREIPDFANKVDVLTKFAIEELGYTQQELAQRTDFSQGDVAAREVVRINKLYEKLNAKPAKKVVKAKATSVEGAGKGKQLSEPNRAQILERAKETGDWGAYFEAKGML